MGTAQVPSCMHQHDSTAEKSGEGYQPLKVSLLPPSADICLHDGCISLLLKQRYTSLLLRLSRCDIAKCRPAVRPDNRP